MTQISKVDFEKYMVKIISDTGNHGSGIIFKPNATSKYAFLISAKHVFGGREMQGLLSVSKGKIQLNASLSKKTVDIELHNQQIFLAEVDEKSLDVAIGIISLSNTNYENAICTLSLFTDEYTLKTDEVYVVGFSNGREQVDKNNFHIIQSETDIFTVRELRSHEFDEELVAPHLASLYSDSASEDYIQSVFDYAQGMSGGGVFIKRKDAIFLYGVLKEVRQCSVFKHHRLREDGVIDLLLKLPKIYNLEDYNFKLSSTCFLGGESDLDFEEVISSKDLYSLIEKINLNKENNNYIRKLDSAKQSNSNFSLNKLIKELNISDSISSKKSEFSNELIKISDYYCYLGLLFSEENDYHRAAYYLTQAAKLNPRYMLVGLKEKASRLKNGVKVIKSNEVNDIYSKAENAYSDDGEKIDILSSIMDITGDLPLEKIYHGLELIKGIELHNSNIGDDLIAKKNKFIGHLQFKVAQSYKDRKITHEGYHLAIARLMEDYCEIDAKEEIVFHCRMALNFIKLKNDESQNLLKLSILDILESDSYKNISIERKVEKEFDEFLIENGGKERYLQQEMVKSIQSSIERTSDEIRKVVDAALKSNELNVSQQNTYYSNIDEKITFQSQQYKEITNKIESVFSEINNRIGGLEVDPVRKTELLNSLVNVKADILNELSSNSDKSNALMKHIYDSTLERTGNLSDLIGDFSSQTNHSMDYISTQLSSRERFVEKQMEVLKDIGDKLSILENQASLKKVSVTFNVKTMAVYLSLMSLSSLLTYLAIKLI